MQGSWFPCTFSDERQNTKSEIELISRQAIVQFGKKGDAPVNPDGITFLVTSKKLIINELQMEISCIPFSSVMSPQDLSWSWINTSRAWNQIRWNVSCIGKGCHQGTSICTGQPSRLMNTTTGSDAPLNTPMVISYSPPSSDARLINPPQHRTPTPGPQSQTERHS